MGQSLISQDQNHNSPLSFPPKSFSRKKSIIEPISTAENHLPEDLEGLPNILITEKKKAAKNIISLLKLRKKYRFQGHRDYEHCENLIEKLPGSTEPIINYNKTIEMLPTLSKSSLILNEDGVYEVMVDGKMVGKKILTALEFLDDLAEMVKHIHKSLNKSLSNNRLALLDERYQMYKLRYSEKEQFEAQAIVHRDFYNCRKVDTHIHFAACMRAKQLLRFMVEKIEKDGDRNVIFDKGENKWKSLREICQRINVDSKDINLDSLNVQVTINNIFNNSKRKKFSIGVNVLLYF